MMGTLAQLADAAQPTPFHHLLKTLNDRGKLLRVYTQNIDCLEERAGLDYGLPVWEEQRKSRSSKGKAKALDHAQGPGAKTGLLTPPPSHRPTASPERATSYSDREGSGVPQLLESDSTPGAGPSASASTTVGPRCIPLHGHLKTLYCPLCFHSVPFLPHVDELVAGDSVPCPSCEDLEATRRLVGKRERGVGQMRPAVVLYGESHREGEVIGECVRRDLLGKPGPRANTVEGSPMKPSSSSRAKAGAAPDLLIVAGTSLKIPGTKRLVREFSKAVKTKSPASGSSTTAGSVKTIFLNFEFPSPARDWEGVFDTWLQGDVQTLAAAVSLALKRQDEKARVAALVQTPSTNRVRTTAASTGVISKKRKMKTEDEDVADVTPTKRRGVKIIRTAMDVRAGPSNEKSTTTAVARTKERKVTATNFRITIPAKRTIIPVRQQDSPSAHRSWKPPHVPSANIPGLPPSSHHTISTISAVGGTSKAHTQDADSLIQCMERVGLSIHAYSAGHHTHV